MKCALEKRIVAARTKAGDRQCEISEVISKKKSPKLEVSQ